MTPHLTDFIRPIASLTFAGCAYIAQTVAPSVAGLPDWIHSLGLPVAMLLATIYALVGINKALADQVTGRLADKDAATKNALADRDSWIAQLRADNDKSNDLRAKLIESSDAQTAAFEKLADQLRSRPCQKNP